MRPPSLSTTAILNDFHKHVFDSQLIEIHHDFHFANHHQQGPWFLQSTALSWPERLGDVEMTQPFKLACPHLLTPEGNSYQLLGSRCTHCGEIYFPSSNACTRCSSTEFESHPLGSSGVLWSWTVQDFLPKSPYNSGETEATFQPYGVGYVQMVCGIKVESRLILDEFKMLEIGMPMHLTLQTYRTDDHGQPWATFAFKTAVEKSHEQ